MREHLVGDGWVIVQCETSSRGASEVAHFKQLFAQRLQTIGARVDQRTEGISAGRYLGGSVECQRT